MEEKYELLTSVLKALQAKGILDGLVIVGSWCQYYYRILFDNAPEIPLLRTLDVDFLVPNPARFKNRVGYFGDSILISAVNGFGVNPVTVYLFPAG